MKTGFKRSVLVRAAVVLLAVGAPALSGCGKTDYAKEQQELEAKQKVVDEATIQEYFSRNNITAFRRLDSGIFLLDETTGTGKEIDSGNQIEVKSIGKLITAAEDGVIFDNSTDQRIPCGCYSLTVGAGRFVKGYEDALLEMRQGDRKRIIIPSYLAKSSNGQFLLYPRLAQPVMFDVEVLTVK